MWVHDNVGNLGTVDTETGSADVIGNMGAIMTDIAFDPVGNLFGITFSGLYAIDTTSAAANFIGSHGVSNGNGLVFGNDGTLYAAGSTTTNLYSLNTSSGAGSILGNMGFGSAGDLAFVGSDLFLSSTTGSLVEVILSDLASSSAVGPFGVSGVFGIATDETSTLFAVAGTTIYTVNPATGSATGGVSFAGQGLGTAFGQSFFAESGADPDDDPSGGGDNTPVVPLPASGILLLCGVFGLAVGKRLKASQAKQL
jgi:hypothetical protein